MKIQELKKNSPAQLIEQAEKLGIENASTLRKQEILFAILKKLAEKGEEITGMGVLQLTSRWIWFLRALGQIIYQEQMIFTSAQVKLENLV